MANPRSLVYALYTHWDTVELLVRLSREFAVLTSDQVLNGIAKVSGQRDAETQGAVLRALVNADILQTLPRSSDLQLNAYVLEFVRGLTREHELGLAAVLQARRDLRLVPALVVRVAANQARGDLRFVAAPRDQADHLADAHHFGFLHRRHVLHGQVMALRHLGHAVVRHHHHVGPVGQASCLQPRKQRGRHIAVAALDHHVARGARR